MTRVRAAAAPSPAPVAVHPQRATDVGWKHQLNTLRLLLQPYICAALLLPWLHLFDLPHLQRGLADACALGMSPAWLSAARADHSPRSAPC